MVYTQKSSKIHLKIWAKFRAENSKKGVPINLLLIYYQKVIKSISIGYQNQEFTTENISICNQSTNNLLSN